MLGTCSTNSDKICKTAPNSAAAEELIGTRKERGCSENKPPSSTQKKCATCFRNKPRPPHVLQANKRKRRHFSHGLNNNLNRTHSKPSAKSVFYTRETLKRWLTSRPTSSLPSCFRRWPSQRKLSNMRGAKLTRTPARQHCGCWRTRKSRKWSRQLCSPSNLKWRRSTSCRSRLSRNAPAHNRFTSQTNLFKQSPIMMRMRWLKK